MKKKEFASQIRLRESRFKRGVFAALTVLGLWMTCGPILDHLLNFRENEVIGQSYVIMGAILFGAFLVTLVVLGCQRGVKCPHCRKNLFGVAGQISVATGNCAFCGEKVFD